MTTVLLYSGGMDSVICSQLLKPDICLYVDTRSVYSDKEKDFMTQPPFGKLVYDDRLTLEDQERDDFIVPMRNAFLALVASYHGDEIMLGATLGDRSTDKDQIFSLAMNRLFATANRPCHWLPDGGSLSFHLPFRDKTKADMIEMYIEDDGDLNLLRNSISCYHGQKLHCGKCKPCIRKWAAFAHNDIDITEDYRDDPREFFLNDLDLIDKIRNRSWRGEREDGQIAKVIGGICNV